MSLAATAERFAIDYFRATHGKVGTMDQMVANVWSTTEFNSPAGCMRAAQLDFIAFRPGPEVVSTGYS